MTWARSRSGLYLREGSGLELPGRRPFLHPMPGVVAAGQMSRRRAAAGGGYPWAPTDVTGLLFWWRSDAGVTIDGDSTLVTIADQSGNGLDGTGETGGIFPRKPVVRANATAGFDEIYFDRGGSNWARIVFDASDPFSAVTAGHIFANLRLDNDPPGDSGETGLWDFSPQPFGTNYPWTDGSIYDGWGSTARPQIGDPSTALTSWHTLDVQNQSGASGYKMFINGSQLGSSQTGDGGSWSTAINFGQSLGGGPHFKGSLLDLFMYDHVLTGTDLTNARAYLADRIDGDWFAAENP